MQKTFSGMVPLNMVLGFAEDYERVIINARVELILVLARNNDSLNTGSPVVPSKIELTHVMWKVAHVNRH